MPSNGADRVDRADSRAGHGRRRNSGQAALLIKPQRALDELMDDVSFSKRCLDDYQQRMGGDPRARASERLREEVRCAGYLLDDGPTSAGEYARIRVNGRFDIVVFHKPSPEQPAQIDRLRYPEGRQRRPRQSGRSAA